MVIFQSTLAKEERSLPIGKIFFKLFVSGLAFYAIILSGFLNSNYTQFYNPFALYKYASRFSEQTLRRELNFEFQITQILIYSAWETSKYAPRDLARCVNNSTYIISAFERENSSIFFQGFLLL